MKKVLLLTLSILLLCSHGMAQEEQDSITVPTTTKHYTPIRKFERFVKQFIDFNNYDTTYISPNRYNYALMLTNNTIFEDYRIGSSGAKEQHLSFAPNPNFKIGAYFGWRWLFIGWSIDASDIFGGKNKNKQKKTEFTLNLYSSKIGVDFYYWRIGSDFKLYNLKGFNENNPSEAPFQNSPSQYEPFHFDGINANIKGINMYYIFNNRHFSYPAAFSQSTNQRKSVGSALAGISYSTHNMTFDYMKLPSWILNQLEEPLKVNKVNYKDFSIHFGYAYNWVFAPNFLACFSIAPAIAYKRSHTSSPYKDNNTRYHSINLDLISRAGIVYNNSKYFVGASWVGHTYDYEKHDFSINNTLGNLQFYIGFNFGLKTQYRKK